MTLFRCSHDSTDPWTKAIKMTTDLEAPENVNILHIDFKHFDHMVAGIAENFPNLKTLFAFENLKFLETENFENMEKLESLRLGKNPLKELKENVFEKLENLRYLGLMSNHLESLPAKIFSHLKKLKTIILSDNKLTDLDEELFANNLNIESIKLDGNKLKRIDVDFTRFERIKNLNLLDNVCINLHYENNKKDSSTIQKVQESINENCQGS
jgi:Leucine-rich repeat (LRR) protein